MERPGPGGMPNNRGDENFSVPRDSVSSPDLDAVVGFWTAAGAYGLSLRLVPDATQFSSRKQQAK
jgi:hypothetical protein